MGILSEILGTGDVVKAGFDLIDSMHTSDQEEIEANSKAKVDLMKAYAPFKKAQRLLMLGFMFTYLSSFFLILVMTLNESIGNPADVKNLLSEFYIGEIMLAIVGFYFGGGFLEGAISKNKEPELVRAINQSKKIKPNDPDFDD